MIRTLQKYNAIMTGNEAVAMGAKLARVRFISAYPITPQTTIVEKLAEMIANRELDARYVEVESEHSAMAATMASELTGTRSYTATSSHGLLYMHEMLHWVAGQRLPVVMSVVNRAIGPPWNIWSDQTDTMNQKDTGWMQVYCESNQEALDTILMGYRIAEDRNVMLPLMTMEDAFVLSHTSEPVNVPEQKAVDDFLPELDLSYRIDVDRPMGYGSYSTPDGPFMELKKDMHDSMDRARKAIRSVTAEFATSFDRNYSGLIEEFLTEDADYVLIASGTLASTGKYVIQRLREKGYKVGLIRIRFFRPFPADEIRKAVKGTKGTGIIDRSISFGSGGNTFLEVSSSLYGTDNPPLYGFIAGLGGRDVKIEDFEEMFRIMEKKEPGQYWINIRRGD
ncbi:MAG: pyruvate ferredoxin oxidoreductase [Candidatus Thermoplasmatota archaeon]|jgi:2-oxoisovalerate ferredoxin oxidoreductase alpha subunit|nr:pyruvate ferredoxin oxidoreductase [Candidatus Thermoplasmatota archaeon]MCL5954509.1 pyruvate ferredoxin oxidoreductase [Candidatus Thermoplasmatota archaeon]